MYMFFFFEIKNLTVESSIEFLEKTAQFVRRQSRDARCHIHTKTFESRGSSIFLCLRTFCLLSSRHIVRIVNCPCKRILIGNHQSLEEILLSDFKTGCVRVTRIDVM